jgi:type IV secretion system protein TrbF
MLATVPSESGTPSSAAVTRPLPNAEPAKAAEPKPQAYNPYLAGRREWDERYGDLVARAKKANRIAIICASIALLETVAFVVMVLRPPKVIVVAVNSSGQVLGSGASDQPLVITEGMKRSTLSEWVSNFRLVTPDGVSQRGAIDKVYAMISSGSSAQSMVSDFYRAEPPQTRAQSETVHVEVNSVLPTSAKTYEVEWVEVTRDLQGKVLQQQRWKGAFSFVVSLSPPNDERLSRLNPIGLYITAASWSQVL